MRRDMDDSMVRPLPRSLRPISYPRRDSRWRGHIDFKPWANGQPPDPATNLLSLVGVGNHPASQPANLPTCQLTIHPTTATTYPPSPLLLPPTRRHREQAEASMIHSRSWCPTPDLACGWLVFNEYNAVADHIEYENGKSTSASAVLLLRTPPIRIGIPVDSALCRIK